MATNLFGRGMDIERVNIVFNYDMPEDSDTYLHRVSGPPRGVTSLTAPSWGGDVAQLVLRFPRLCLCGLTHVPVSAGGPCGSLWHQGPGYHFCV